jgi:hypothetical protein
MARSSAAVVPGTRSLPRSLPGPGPVTVALRASGLGPGTQCKWHAAVAAGPGAGLGFKLFNGTLRLTGRISGRSHWQALLSSPSLGHESKISASALP